MKNNKSQFPVSAAARALKTTVGSLLLEVQQVPGFENNYIVTNGQVVFFINQEDHAAIVQPITNHPAGNYRFSCGIISENKKNIVDIVNRHIENTMKAAYALDFCPFRFSEKKRTVAGCWNPHTNTPVLLNAAYVDAFPADSIFYSSGSISPVVALNSKHEIIGLIMPMAVNKSPLVSSVSAYFGSTQDQSPDLESLKLEHLRAENELSAALAAAREENAALLQQLETLREECEDMEDIKALQEQVKTLSAKLAIAEENAARPATVEPAPAPAPVAAPGSPVEIALAKFSGFTDISAIVKGAKTASPVIWFSGNVSAHRKELATAGARWSPKKSAYYYSVA